MNLVAAITLHAGGPGSGCTGPNCGRKRVFDESSSLDRTAKQALKALTQQENIFVYPNGAMKFGGGEHVQMIHDTPYNGNFDKFYKEGSMRTIVNPKHVYMEAQLRTSDGIDRAIDFIRSLPETARQDVTFQDGKGSVMTAFAAAGSDRHVIKMLNQFRNSGFKLKGDHTESWRK